MNRQPDWHKRLTDYVAVASSQPYSPGRMDCAIFSAGAIEAMTGVDVLRGLRGYRSIPEGLRKARAKGYDGPEEVFAAKLPAIAADAMRAGDLAILPGDNGCALGICQGRLIYGVGPAGVVMAPRSAALRGYRVG